MLTIHITEADPAALVADDTGSKDGLAMCLAHYGVPHDMIQTVFTSLSQVKTVVLCKPSEADAWEIWASVA